MRLPAGLTRLGVTMLAVLGLLAVLVLLGPGRPGPIAGTDPVMRGVLCAVPDPAAPCTGPPVDLPYFGGLSGPEGALVRMRFELPAGLDELAESGPVALYFPMFADGLRVFVNGTEVLRTAPPGGPYWHWNRPAFVPVAAPLLREGRRLDLVLQGAPLFEALLAPFHAGPDLALRNAHDRRQLATLGVARMGLGLIAGCSLAMIALTAIRRRDRAFHWAALAGLAAGVLSLHYAAPRPPLPEPAWLAVWTASLPLLVAALHRFVRRFLRRRSDPAERLTLGFALGSVAALAVLLLVAPRHLLVASALMQAIIIAITIYLLTIVLRDRRFTTRGRFAALYGGLCAAAALALHDTLFLYLRPSPVAMPLGQFMPLVFMNVTGWLVVAQLVTALERQEVLAAKLRGRVIERSRSLRQTADRLRRSEREKLLAEERQRIMMDLHDGVGGHLVNALAGLRRDGNADPHLRDLLEEAQTDLGLMVDSLYNPGDVASLLAALRARLEPLLDRQGMAFDWRVEQAPQLPDPGPSANIDLLRIVQEFVSNTLKHAGARRIVVETGPRHLCLSDDGRGFAGPAARGHGLTSMRRRAARLGAGVDLSSGPGGTMLRLDW